MRVHASDVSVGFSSLFGSPMHGSVPLAGRSVVTDVFAGSFDLSAMSWTCMRAVCTPGQLSSSSVPSRRSIVLPVISKTA